jgi:hypothetical protein
MPRPSFTATEERRRIAKSMAGIGIPHDDIAAVLNITAKTLRKHFRQELTLGAIEANARVGQTLFAMATSGRNIAASIYWDRTRGIRRRSDSEIGSGNMPPPQIIIRTDDEEKRTPEGGKEQ